MFAVVVCFRVASSACTYHVLSAQWQCGVERDGYTPCCCMIRQQNSMCCFILSMLSAYLTESTSGHLFRQSVALFKWSVSYFRSDASQSFTTLVFRSYSNTIPVVSAYKEYLPYRWSQITFCTCSFQQTPQLHFSPPLQELKSSNYNFRHRKTVTLLFISIVFFGYHMFSLCSFATVWTIIVARRGWVCLCKWGFKQSKVCVSNLCRRNVLTWFDWLSLGEKLLSCHSAASVTSQFAWWLFAIPCEAHRFDLVSLAMATVLSLSHLKSRVVVFPLPWT